MAENRRLPHLRPFARQPIVFLTVVTHERRSLLACAEAQKVLRAVWLRSPEIDGGTVGRYVLMPDHVHLFARATADAKSLSKWVQTWKSVSSRQLLPLLGTEAPLWQRDYFDRYLRSADSFSDKWDYVAANPVRRALVAHSGDWPWQGVLENLSF